MNITHLILLACVWVCCLPELIMTRPVANLVDDDNMAYALYLVKTFPRVDLFVADPNITFPRESYHVRSINCLVEL